MPNIQKIILIIYSCFISLFASSQSKRHRDEIRNLIKYHTSNKPLLSQTELFRDFNDYFSSKPIEPYIFYKGNDKELRVHFDSMIYIIRDQMRLFIENWKYKPATNKNITTTQGAQIDQEIIKNYRLDRNSRSKTKLANIYQQILFLPYTSERIYLLLEYENLNLSTKDFYNDLYKLWNNSKEEIEKISSVIEKAKAYKILGDFVADKGRSVLAIEMYYLASENFQKTSFNDIELTVTIGNIYGENNLEVGLLKALLYYKIGSIYETEQWSIQELDYIEALIQFYWRYGSSNSQNLTSDSSLQAGLNKLIQWHKRYIRGLSSTVEERYLAVSCIGNTLASLHKYQHAFPYLTQAFFYAIQTETPSYISSSLYNIATVCKDYGKFQLALDYLSLENELSDSLNNYSATIHSYLNRANFLLDFGDTASSYLLVSNIEKDTAIFARDLYPPFYHQILEKISHLKFEILESDASKIDSARYYENKNQNYYISHLNELMAKLDFESMTLLGLVNRANAIALATSDSLARSQKEIALLAKKSEKQVIEKYNLTVIAKLRADTIIALTEEKLRDEKIIAEKEKLILQQAIDRKEREKQEEKEKQEREITIGILISLAIIAFLLYRNSARKKASAKELIILNSLAKTKIHDMKNDYSNTGNLIITKQYDLLEDYNAYYSSYLSHSYSNWEKGEISIIEELIVFERYLESHKLVKPGLTYIKQIEITDPQRVRFIQSVFDTLLSNSIKHGFKQMLTDMVVSITITKSGNHISCIYQDNGIPPSNDDAYLSRKDSGLNILRKRIYAFNNKRQRLHNTNIFSIASLPERKGTILELKLPYEKVKNINH